MTCKTMWYFFRLRKKEGRSDWERGGGLFALSHKYHLKELFDPVVMCTRRDLCFVPYTKGVSPDKWRHGFKEILFRTFRKWSEEISSRTLYWIEISSRTFLLRYPSVHTVGDGIQYTRWRYHSVHSVGDTFLYILLGLSFYTFCSLGEILPYIPSEIFFFTFRWIYSSINSVCDINLYVHSIGDILLCIPFEIASRTFLWRYPSVHSDENILVNIPFEIYIFTYI